MGVCRNDSDVIPGCQVGDARCSQTTHLRPVCGGDHGRTLSALRSPDAAWLETHAAAAVLAPGWREAAVSERPGDGLVLLCPDHAEALQVELRARSPGAWVRRGLAQVGRGVLKYDDWAQDAASFASLGTQLASPALAAVGATGAAGRVQAGNQRVQAAHKAYTMSGKLQAAAEAGAGSLLGALGAAPGQAKSMLEWAAGSGAAWGAKRWLRGAVGGEGGKKEGGGGSGSLAGGRA